MWERRGLGKQGKGIKGRKRETKLPPLMVRIKERETVESEIPKSPAPAPMDLLQGLITWDLEFSGRV